MRRGRFSSGPKPVLWWLRWLDPGIDKLVDFISVIVQTSSQADLRLFGEFSIFCPDAVCP